MTDTPISLLRIVLESYEDECKCDRRAPGQETRCLHCRIKSVLVTHDKHVTERLPQATC